MASLRNRSNRLGVKCCSAARPYAPARARHRDHRRRTSASCARVARSSPHERLHTEHGAHRRCRRHLNFDPWRPCIRRDGRREHPLFGELHHRAQLTQRGVVGIRGRGWRGWSRGHGHRPQSRRVYASAGLGAKTGKRRQISGKSRGPAYITGRSLVVRHGPRRGLAGRLCPNSLLGNQKRFDDVVGPRFTVVTSESLSERHRDELAHRGAGKYAYSASEPTSHRRAQRSRAPGRTGGYAQSC